MSRDMNRRDFLKTAAVTGTMVLTVDMLKSAAFADYDYYGQLLRMDEAQL
jgi:hypothetical protein